MTPPAAASSRALLRRLEDDPCQLSRKKTKQQRDVKVDDALNPPWSMFSFSWPRNFRWVFENHWWTYHNFERHPGKLQRSCGKSASKMTWKPPPGKVSWPLATSKACGSPDRKSICDQLLHKTLRAYLDTSSLVLLQSHGIILRHSEVWIIDLVKLCVYTYIRLRWCLQQHLWRSWWSYYYHPKLTQTLPPNLAFEMREAQAHGTTPKTGILVTKWFW